MVTDSVGLAFDYWNGYSQSVYHISQLNYSKFSLHSPFSRNYGILFSLWATWKELQFLGRIATLFPSEQLMEARAPPTSLLGKRTEYFNENMDYWKSAGWKPELLCEVKLFPLKESSWCFFCFRCSCFWKTAVLSVCAGEVFDAVLTWLSGGIYLWFLREAAADQF